MFSFWKSVLLVGWFLDTKHSYMHTYNVVITAIFLWFHGNLKGRTETSQNSGLDRFSPRQIWKFNTCTQLVIMSPGQHNMSLQLLLHFAKLSVPVQVQSSHAEHNPRTMWEMYTPRKEILHLDMQRSRTKWAGVADSNVYHQWQMLPGTRSMARKQMLG